MHSLEIRRFRDLGAVIKAVRESRGIRQEDMAENLAFSRHYLRELEIGKPNLYISRLFRALHHLGIRVTITYDLNETGSAADPVVESTKSLLDE